MPPEYQKLLVGLPIGFVDAMHRHGLALKPGMDTETLSHLVSGVVNLAGRTTQSRDTLTAWLGDLLSYGQGNFRGQIAEYAKAAGMNACTLRCAKLVASRIPVLCRHNTLSWSHHCEIARGFENLDEIKQWIQLAVDEQLSTKELRQRIRIHLKEPSGFVLKDDTVQAGTFLLLRELRATGRVLGAQGKGWKAWPPETCAQALGEIKALADFVDHLRTRSAQKAAS